MRIVTLFPAAALLLLPEPATAEAATGACAALAAEKSGSFCTENDGGIAIAGTLQRAQQLLDLAGGGQKRFALSFNKPALRFAIIEIGNDGLSKRAAEAVFAANIPVVLPWLSPEAYNVQVEQSIRRSVEEQIAKTGLTGIARDAAIESAMVQVRQKMRDGAEAQINPTAIPHELGHMWLIRGYWTTLISAKSEHYGGPAPDWFDEMAAVLMEPDESKAKRRSQFWERYQAIRAEKQRLGDITDRILELAEYLTIQHPAAQAVRDRLENDAGEPVSGKATVKVFSGDDAQSFAGDSIRFYLQSLLFSDYLAARSQKPAIFGAIATALSQGTTFPQWLDQHGKAHGLPATTEAMESDWLDWLAKTEPKAIS